MPEGSKSKEVQEWYNFGALTSVQIIFPGFSKISKVPEWITMDAW